MSEAAFNQRKLEELVLYIAQRSQDDPQFGKTKLAKLLAFIDFLAFERHGEPLTGATYIKLDFGPAPDQLPSALNRLRQAERLHIAKEERYGYDQTGFTARDAPSVEGVFRPGEIRLVDEVLDRFASWNNTEIQELAHRQFVGWQRAHDGDPIPYDTHYLSPMAPTENEMRQGRELAAAAKRERGL